MFMFKKIVSQFLSPVTLIIVIIFAGLFYLWFTKKQTRGKLLVSVAFIALLLLSNGDVTDKITGYLERGFQPQDMQMASGTYYDAGDEDFIKYVVVLGGGHTSNPELPVSSQVSDTTMVRLVEGIRLYRKHLGSKLILSGGSVFDPLPGALIMADIARELGVNEYDIITESGSQDTKDEARLIKQIVNDESFILVTSAAHMNRSVAMFRKLGMNPIPAPTGHMFSNVRRDGPLSYFPKSGNLCNSESAFHEYLGMVWASLRGQI